MSTSMEGPPPSGPSWLPEHTGRHLLAPAPRADDIGEWMCLRLPPCGMGWSSKEAVALMEKGEARFERFAYSQQAYRALAPEPEEEDPTCTDCGHSRSYHFTVNMLCQDDDGLCKCPGYTDVIPAEPEEPAPSEAVLEVARRLPVAVAYATTGGHLFEVVTPGDAVVSAIDGKLVIEHHGLAVLGIVRTMPWPPPAAEGEPDGPGTEDPEG